MRRVRKNLFKLHIWKPGVKQPNKFGVKQPLEKDGLSLSHVEFNKPRGEVKAHKHPFYSEVRLRSQTSIPSNSKHQPISVRLSGNPRRHVPKPNAANPRNLKRVQLTKWNLPRIINTNVRSLPNKIDDLNTVINSNHIDVAVTTESWLNDDIPDQAVSINGYTLFRKDRKGRTGGGVACFVKSSLTVHHWTELQDEDVESVWLTVRSHKMPRVTPWITFGAIYHPPDAKEYILTAHISKCIDTIRRKHPRTGIILAGDFNRYQDNHLKRSFQLKQVVVQPTRENSILDKIYSNMSDLYTNTSILPHVGRSDHCVVLYVPKESNRCPSKVNICVRRSGSNERTLFAHALLHVNWEPLYLLEDVSAQLLFFQTTIHTLLDEFIPVTEKLCNINDKPWINQHYLDLIRKRQHAFKSQQMTLYKHLCNKVNRLSTKLRKSYYQDKLLEIDNPRDFWCHVKTILGTKQSPSLEGLANKLYGGDFEELASRINLAFKSVSDDLPPLELKHSHTPVEIPSKYIISVEEMSWKLGHLSVTKASGPDQLPNWVLRDFCDILAPPVTSIANNSLRQRLVPPLWKCADVCAIPKVSPPASIEKDLRPISLTPVVSKVVEEFVYKWVLEVVQPQLHWDQFGALQGSSTVDALVYFLHKLYYTTDKAGAHIRAVLVDYQKAFDHLNHQIIINKLEQLRVPEFLVEWIASFLSGRHQRVKLGNYSSEFVAVNGGVPQGTKLGPLLFLCMIDDLQIDAPCESLKFVDDTTILELLSSKDSVSCMQSTLDSLMAWTVKNEMNLNPTKTKELQINFFKQPVSLGRLEVQQVTSVLTAKLLGVTLSADLKWNYHVESIVKKASKRIYFLTVLKRFGAAHEHLIHVYKTLVRPITEYACQCWHPGLT